MALSTAFTELFGVRHPIALAPMGGFAGGALAAAVSNGLSRKTPASWGTRPPVRRMCRH